MATVKELTEKVDTLLAKIDAEHAQFGELVTVVKDIKANLYIPPELGAKLDLAIEKVEGIVTPESLDEPTPEPVADSLSSDTIIE